MRTRLSLLTGATLLIGLVLAPATRAGGPQSEFQGRAEKDPGTFVGFDVAKHNGKSKITKFQAVLAYTCEDGRGGGYAFAKGRGSITAKPSGRFAGKLRITEFESRRGDPLPGSSYAVAGKLPKHGKARGTADAKLIFGGKNRGSSTSTCYTGRVDWKVTDEPLPPLRHGQGITE